MSSDPGPGTATPTTAHVDGYARLDLGRTDRTGLPEAIYCQGKSVEQVAAIVERLLDNGRQAFNARVAPAAGAVPRGLAPARKRLVVALAQCIVAPRVHHYPRKLLWSGRCVELLRCAKP